MKTQKIISIVTLSLLGLCLLCGLAKITMKKDNCDKVCTIFIFVAVALVGVGQLLIETSKSPTSGKPTIRKGLGEKCTVGSFPGLQANCQKGLVCKSNDNDVTVCQYPTIKPSPSPPSPEPNPPKPTPEPNIYCSAGNSKNDQYNDKCSMKGFRGVGCGGPSVAFCSNTTKQCQKNSDCTEGGCITTGDNYCISCADLCNSVGARDGDDADCLQGILKLTKPDSNSNYDNGGCTSNEKDFTDNPDKFPGGYQKCINKSAQQPRCSGPIFGVKCPANQSWNFNKQTCE